MLVDHYDIKTNHGLTYMNHLLPKEHDNRWRQFWAAKALELKGLGLTADVGMRITLVYRRGSLVEAFTPTDTPELIEERLFVAAEQVAA
jgi:hypothetical protein